jgi:DNA mismatch repair protein MLH3
VFPHGTRVTVRDLFGSMPVRVKQRASEMDKSGAARELEQLVLSIVGLLLVWPDNVSVAIRDAMSSNVLSLRTKEPSQTSNSEENKEASVLLARTPTLLAQASLYEDSYADSWVEVGARGFGVSVCGCVCLVPTATKRLQFIAIGIEPLLNEHSANVLYEEVNSVFANSAFGVIEGESDEDAPGQKHKRHSLRIRDLKARKGIDRWPIFALQIRFEGRPAKQSLGIEEILEDPSADLTVITNLLRALAYQFLKRHHFRPKPVNTTLHSSSASERGGRSTVTGSTLPESGSPSPLAKDQQSLPRNTPKIRGRSTPLSVGTVSEGRPGSPFDAWSRVKVGRPLSATKVRRSTPQAAPTSKKPPLLDNTGRLLRKPFDDHVPTLPQNELGPEGDSPQTQQEREDSGNAQSDTVVWVDPITRIRSTIDSRTGFVVKSDSTPGRRISLRPSFDARGQTRPEPVPWIRDMMSDWQNPAFAPTEPPIPRIPDPLEAVTEPAPGGVSVNCGHLKFGDTSETSMLQFTGRVSKQALRDAEVIGQVDSKFVLVKLALQSAGSAVSREARTASSDSGELLVLIDQHAADERCRVEELQKEYFGSDDGERGANTDQLDKPIQFELPKQEGLLLSRFKEHFEYWGIMYEVQSAETASAQAKTKVQIRSLPPSILERCRLEPRLLIELVRKEAWKLRDEPESAVSTGFRRADIREDGENGWVRRFHGCPQGILDLINSRACRSESWTYLPCIYLALLTFHRRHHVQ